MTGPYSRRGSSRDESVRLRPSFTTIETGRVPPWWGGYAVGALLGAGMVAVFVVVAMIVGP